MAELRCHIHVEIPVRATRFPDHLGRLHLRGCHAVSLPVPGGFGYSSRGVAGHHISLRFPRGIRLDLFRFRSPLLPESLLLSFPARTMMLRLRAFSIRLSPRGGADCTTVLGSYRKSHSEIGGSTASCAYPPHIGAGPVLHRLPSRGIPRLPYCVSGFTFLPRFGGGEDTFPVHSDVRNRDRKSVV